MAKAREQATETLVETAQDLNFADHEREPAPRGADLEDTIDAIRKKRAAVRAARGNAGRKRMITHYHDAERLKALGLLSNEEVVDCEEAGLLPDPAHYYDAGGSSAAVDSEPPDGVA